MIPLTKKVSKKVKTYTPLLIALADPEKEKLKRVPREAIERLLNGKGTVSDLSTLLFRLRWCYEISLVIYSSDTQHQIKEIVDNYVTFFTRYSKDEKGIVFFTLTKEEKEDVFACLDCMDQMQDEVTRKQMLDPAYKARAFIASLAKA